MISVAEAKDEEAVTLTVATYNLYNFPAQIHEEKAERKCIVSYSNPSLSQNLICNFVYFPYTCSVMFFARDTCKSSIFFAKFFVIFCKETIFVLAPVHRWKKAISRAFDERNILPDFRKEFSFVSNYCINAAGLDAEATYVTY